MRKQYIGNVLFRFVNALIYMHVYHHIYIYSPFQSSEDILLFILTSLGTQKAGASVAPGETFTYRWQVREGPSDSDPPCLSYLYYSASDPVRDTNSGLVGPLQVCKKGVLDESGRQVLSHTRPSHRFI